MCGGQTGMQPSTLHIEQQSVRRTSPDQSNILPILQPLEVDGLQKSIIEHQTAGTHCGMEVQASADGSLQVLKQGTAQESYLH